METLPNSDSTERGATDGQVVAHPASAGLEKLGRSVDSVRRGLPGNEPAWGRFAALLFKSGVAITTTFVAGWIVTWVRFESLAGVGDTAVVAADKGDLFATGIRALLGTIVNSCVIALVLLGCFAGWTRLKRRPPHRLRRLAGVGASVWRYLARRPWKVHLVAPLTVTASVIALANVGCPEWIGLPLLIGSVLSLIGGGFRLLEYVMEQVMEGRSAWARRLRIPVLLMVGVLGGTLWLVTVVSWRVVVVVLVLLLFVPVLRWRGRDVAADKWTLSLLFDREPQLMALIFVVLSMASAVAAEADRPSGLTVASVTPVQGAAFDGIPLGQHAGRSVFLKVDHLGADGVIELTPGSLRSVAVQRMGVYAPKDERTMGKRLLDWASQKNWAIENSRP
jgi:hypothetical protein